MKIRGIINKIVKGIEAIVNKVRDKVLALFRKKAVAEPILSNNIEEYKNKIARYQRRRWIGIIVLVVLILSGVSIAKYTIDNQTYDSYKVLAETPEEDTAASRYIDLNGNILKYSGNDAILTNSSGKVLWTQKLDIETPMIDICEDLIVIYAKRGTKVVVLGKDGKIGEFNTDKPILKAKVAAHGAVATVLEDGGNTWINYYSATGEQIMTAKTRVDSPGYPVDIAISPDGVNLMVSYLKVEGGTTKSYVAFYNFGNAGQNQMDNMVSDYTYSNILVPQVEYLDDSLAVAFRDNGFVLYEGKQIPKEVNTVEVNEEIISAFYSDKYIGLVFRSDEEDMQYKLALYTKKGKLKFEQSFDAEYSTIKISGDTILMYNEAKVFIMSDKGVMKFSGNVDEGTILNLFKMDANRYRLVTSRGVKTIKLT